MGHSQSANVIVDVENGHDGGTLLLTATGDVKPSHICSNAMQISSGGGNGGNGVGCQTKVPLGNDGYGTKNNQMSNRNCSNNVVQGQQDHHLVQTIVPIKGQPPQQHYRNNANQGYNMMTMPKLGGGLMHQQQQQQQTHLTAINYSNRNDCATLPRNINSSNSNVGNNIGNC